MANCDSINYLVLTMTILLLIMTVLLVTFNKQLFGMREQFVTCYPNSNYGNVLDSYRSPIKGWCKKGASVVDPNNINLLGEASSNYGSNNICQRQGHSPIAVKYSQKSDTKAWCKKSNMDTGF